MSAFFHRLSDLALAGLLGLIPLLLAGLALRLLRRARLVRARGADGERQVAATLAELDRPAMHDILIPDGRGGLTQIDHVLQLPGGLLALETKHYQGDIDDGPDEPNWTQRLGGRRFTLPNPLRQNAGHVRALQRLLPEAAVCGRVVFTDAAHFPTGVPEGVSRLSSLPADLAPLLAVPANDRVADAWRRLRQAARTDRQARRAHRAQLRIRHGRGRRETLALGLLAAAGIWATALVALALLRRD